MEGWGRGRFWAAAVWLSQISEVWRGGQQRVGCSPVGARQQAGVAAGSSAAAAQSTIHPEGWELKVGLLGAYRALL